LRATIAVFIRIVANTPVVIEGLSGRRDAKDKKPAKDEKFEAGFVRPFI